MNGFDAQILTSAEMTDDGGAALLDAHPGMTLLPSQGAAFRGAARAHMIKAVGMADILHLHTMWSPLAALAAREARRQGKPYILSPHGMLDPYSMGQKRLRKLLYLALVEKKTLRAAARLLFTAEDEKRLAEPVTGPMPSAVIPLGADRPPSPSAILRAEFLFHHPDLAVRKCAIFLGRLHDKKRPQSAVHAISQVRQSHPDACLLIAGSGEAEIELREMVQTLKLDDHVRFLGFLTGREKWQALAAAEVFLLPSRQENFAIALAEALHAGVPALLTQHVNIWREIIVAGAGEVLNEEELETSLATSMISFFDDPTRQAKASAAARNLASSAFDWAHSAALTHGLYKQILAR